MVLNAVHPSDIAMPVALFAENERISAVHPYDFGGMVAEKPLPEASQREKKKKQGKVG